MEEKTMQQIRYERMLETLDGIELTEKEKKSLYWLADWAEGTVNRIDNIFKKCLEQK